MIELENRELGEQMIAEGWRAIDDDIYWCHEPSRLVVEVSEYRWNQVKGIGAYPSEPSVTDQPGWVVGWRRFDELGNPVWPCTQDDYKLVWVESWSKALEIAVECRRRILQSGAAVESSQLNFDDYLEANK